jgi:hypothetical protein
MARAAALAAARRLLRTLRRMLDVVRRSQMYLASAKGALHVAGGGSDGAGPEEEGWCSRWAAPPCPACPSLSSSGQ